MSFLHEVSTSFVLNARGPLANMPALDVMWVSFYSIGLMLLAIVVVSATRKWVKNALLYFVAHVAAFIAFIIGTILMFLVVATWPA